MGRPRKNSDLATELTSDLEPEVQAEEAAAEPAEPVYLVDCHMLDKHWTIGNKVTASEINDKKRADHERSQMHFDKEKRIPFAPIDIDRLVSLGALKPLS